jgi:hypothetical protein
MDSIWSKFVMKQLVWTFKQFKPWFTIQNEAFQTISTSYENFMNFKWHQQSMEMTKSFISWFCIIKKNLHKDCSLS